MEEFYKADRVRLYNIDNLELLKKLPDNSINIIYCDVLYNTNSNFNDYSDKLGTPRQAVDWYKPRFKEIHRVLKEDGSLYIHCDWHLSSYLRVLLDQVFGFENFKNEIIRQCTNAKNNSTNWGRIYDNILFYTKSKNYTWNPPMESKIESDLVKQYNKVNEKGERYTTVPLHAKGVTKNGETGKDWNSTSHGLVPLIKGRHWAVNHSEMERMDREGLIEWSKSGNPRKILYAKDYMDKPVQNIWNMKSSGGSSLFKDMVYDTEKPIELLDKIIRTSTNENDVVADFFMGGGSTAVSAYSLNRKFIGCDINKRACELTKDKLNKLD